MLTYSKLYAYIYGNLAKIDFSKAQVSGSKRNELVAARKAAIRAEFNVFADDFAPLFRGALRNLKAVDLETVLYGNTTDSLMTYKSASRGIIETDEGLMHQFDKDNKKYRFFDPNDQAARQQYALIFRISRLMQFFFERSQRNGALLTRNQYKLLVAFGATNKSNPFEGITNYMKSNNIAGTPHATTRLLDFHLPINKNKIDLTFWRTYIQRYGSMLHFFQFANALTDICKPGIGSANFKSQVAQRAYKQYANYPELAELCGRFHVPEKAFDLALAIDLQRKKFDLMPDEKLDGQAVGHPGYVLVKLPIDDPRAYLLGHYTACCQSIDAHNGIVKCIQKGVQSPHAGFYVLLKGEGAVFNPDGQINYDHYDIAGQAYAWLNHREVLVFDSWENKQRTRDDPVIIDMLPEYARRTAAAKPYIKAITIGSGGATPKALGYAVEFEENTREHRTPYVDARKQRLIYKREKNINQRLAHYIKRVYGLNPKFNKKAIKHGLRRTFPNEGTVKTIDRLTQPKYHKHWAGLSEPLADDINEYIDELINQIRGMEKLLDEAETYGDVTQEQFEHLIFYGCLFGKVSTWPKFESSEAFFAFLKKCASSAAAADDETSMEDMIALYITAQQNGLTHEQYSTLTERSTRHAGAALALYNYCVENNLKHYWERFIYQKNRSLDGKSFIRFHKAGVLSEKILKWFNTNYAPPLKVIINALVDSNLCNLTLIHTLIDIDESQDENERDLLHDLRQAILALRRNNLLTEKILNKLVQAPCYQKLMCSLISMREKDSNCTADDIAQLFQLNAKQLIFVTLYSVAIDPGRLPTYEISGEEDKKIIAVALAQDDVQTKEYEQDALARGLLNPMTLGQCHYLLTQDVIVLTRAFSAAFSLVETQTHTLPAYKLGFLDILETSARLARNNIEPFDCLYDLYCEQDLGQTQAFAAAVRLLDKHQLLDKDNVDKLCGNLDNVEVLAEGIALQAQNRAGVSGNSMFSPAHMAWSRGNVPTDVRQPNSQPRLAAHREAP